MIREREGLGQSKLKMAELADGEGMWGQLISELSSYSCSVELELQNPEFKIWEVQNREFTILDSQTPEFKISDCQNPEFTILDCQNPEFTILDC